VQQGRLGGQRFVTVEDGLLVEGTVLVKEKQNIFYPRASGEPARAEPPVRVAAAGRHQRRVEVPASPSRFSFCRQSPLFDTAPLLLDAKEFAVQTLKLWSVFEGGPLGMAARATCFKKAAVAGAER